MTELADYMLYLIAIGFIVHALFKKNANSSSGGSTTKSEWQDLNALADGLGLTFSEYHNEDHNGGWIHGTYQNFAVSVQDEAVRHGSGSTTYVVVTTLFEVYLSEEHAHDGMEVVPEQTTSKISKLFGAEDIQIGDTDLDQAFVIRAPSEHAAQSFFANTEIRNSFLNLQRFCPRFYYKNGVLTLEYNQSIFHDHHQIRNRLDALAECAHAIINRNDMTQHQLPEPVQLAEPVPPAETFLETDFEPPEDTTIHW